MNTITTDHFYILLVIILSTTVMGSSSCDDPTTKTDFKSAMSSLLKLYKKSMSKIILKDHGLEVLDGIAELFEEKSYLDSWSLDSEESDAEIVALKFVMDSAMNESCKYLQKEFQIDDGDDFDCAESVMKYQEMYRMKYRLQEKLERILSETLSDFNCQDQICEWLHKNIDSNESISPEIKQAIGTLSPNYCKYLNFS